MADPKDSTPTPTDSGWKTQSPWLKLVLVVSLVFVVVGVYRCSSELTPSEDPGTIRVERATVDVPDSLVAVPPDSFAALATRLFAKGLRNATEAEVSVGEDPSAWAVVRLHVRGRSDGRVDLVGVASSVVGGRRLAGVTVADSPDRLREMTAEASRQVAHELSVATGAAPDSASTAEER